MEMELTNGTEVTNGTNPLNPDTDGDGVTDGTEATDGTNPSNSCSFVLTSQTLPTSAAWNVRIVMEMDYQMEQKLPMEPTH